MGRQTTCNNVQASSTSEYYRRAIWYPYLDCTITAMKDKFSIHHLTVMKLVALVPSVIEKKEWKDIADAVLFYKSGGLANLASEKERCNEFQQWKALFFRMPEQDRSKSPLKALDIIPQRYENINHLLQIFCTLPVTSCTAERAFRTLKLLKTYLRNSITDERLTRLVLMYIHPDINIDVETVIDRLAAQKKNHSVADDDSIQSTNVKRQRF